jgi:hypothetical protein
MRRTVLALCFLALSNIVRADSLPTGTWVRRDPLPGGALTLTVEAVGSGRKLTYKFGPNAPAGSDMVVVTQLDGKDAPVLLDGKPTGQTMGIRVIDSRHTFAVMKFQGKEGTTAKSELSADGKVLKVENMMADNGPVVLVEYWDKK